MNRLFTAVPVAQGFSARLAQRGGNIGGAVARLGELLGALGAAELGVGGARRAPRCPGSSTLGKPGELSGSCRRDPARRAKLVPSPPPEPPDADKAGRAKRLTRRA
jgi:hypothetical protein